MRAWLRACLQRRAPGWALRHLALDHMQTGRCGEELAARYLAALGWRVLGRRVHTPMAEIDIVARCGNEFVCVEVKTSRATCLPRPRGGVPIRAATAWRPGQRLSHDQLERQRRASRYLARCTGAGRAAHARVDLIEIVVERRGAARIEHRRDLTAALGSECPF